VDTFCKCMLLISIDSSSSQGVEEEVEWSYINKLNLTYPNLHQT
jgi:hypothetical protein